jgi:hypothetical protein
MMLFSSLPIKGRFARRYFITSVINPSEEHIALSSPVETRSQLASYYEQKHQITDSWRVLVN